MDAQDKKIATDLSYEIIKEVSRATRPYFGTPEAGTKVKMGADGTPTSYIDIVAEEIVIRILKEAKVYSYIISEEIGELRLGKCMSEDDKVREQRLVRWLEGFGW